MKIRLLTIAPALIVAAAATQVMATAVEIDQYLGNDPASNPVYQVQRNTGGQVNIPVYVRPLRGDNTLAFTGIRAFRFKVTGVDAGIHAGDVAARSADTPGQGTDGAITWTAACQRNDQTTAPVPNPAAGFDLFGNLGCVSVTSDSNSMNSDGSGLPYSDPTNHAFLLTWLRFTIPAGLPVGAELQLYMNTPSSVNSGQSRYVVNSTAGTHRSIAFGALDDGTMDQNQLNVNPPTEMNGAGVNHTSTLPDAIIRIVPEPATIGLLAVAALGLRRRRA